MTSSSLPTFSGANIDFPHFWQLLLNAARLAGPNVSIAGVVPELFLDPNDPYLQTIIGLQLPYVPVAPAGPRPLLPPNPTVAQVGLFNAELSDWCYSDELSRAAILERTTFLSHFLASLPPDTIAAISDPVHGTAHFTLTTAASLSALIMASSLLMISQPTNTLYSFPMSLPYPSAPTPPPTRKLTILLLLISNLSASTKSVMLSFLGSSLAISTTSRSSIIYPRILSLPNGILRFFALLSMPGLTPSAIPPPVACSTLLPSHQVPPHPILLPSLAPSSPTILSIPLVPLPAQRFVLRPPLLLPLALFIIVGPTAPVSPARAAGILPLVTKGRLPWPIEWAAILDGAAPSRCLS